MSASEYIKRLREETGVSVMVCKKALEEANGDYDKALTLLKRESAKIADKKKERVTASGVVVSYVHNNKIGVLVEVRCETDFVARNEAFIEFARGIAMHVAAMNPHFISVDKIPDDIKAEMRAIFEKETSELNKPQDLKDKIVSGKLDAYLAERSLYSQPFVKNQDIMVADHMKEMIQKFGENMAVARFVRFEL